MKSASFRFLPLLCLIVLLAAAFACPSLAEEETHIVILATSDMHADVWGYAYEDDRETDNSGMARLYTYIQQVREENPIVFLVDGGDDIQGSILTDDLANKSPDSAHPVITAMNYMGYDAMTLGNHEFNWGINTMVRIVSQAEFPVLGANVLNRDGSCVTGKGWVLLERGGVRLAVIGVCTPDIPIWDADKEGIRETVFEPAYTAVERAMKEIGDRADIVLVSAHLGQFPEFDWQGGSDSGEKILEENPGVDILQLAHMHTTVNEKIRGVPTVGVRSLGREIARIDVTLGPDRQIKDITTGIVSMADVEPSEAIREIPAVKELHGQALRLIRGDSQKNALGYTTARFQPDNEIRGLPEGRLRDTAVIDLILKVELINSGADVASCALFKPKSDLPEGAIYYRNIFDIYKFDNTLYTLTVTGRELKAYMEWSAECYNQWMPGDINISFDPDYPDYLYDMFAGVQYEINLSRPKGQRIENVMFRGEPLRDDQELKLAVNNYRYTSGLQACGLAKGNRDWESSCSIRDMLVSWFAENSPVAPEVDSNWRITGVDLSPEDPRRAELIRYINEGRLPTPYYKSYNLADYDALVAEAQENQPDFTEPDSH